MTCQIASVAHYLPPLIDVDMGDMSELERQETRLKAAEEHQDEVLDDEIGRDIVWPIEKVRGTMPLPVFGR